MTRPASTSSQASTSSELWLPKRRRFVRLEQDQLSLFTATGELVDRVESVLAAYWVPGKGLEVVRHVRDGREWLGVFRLRRRGDAGWTQELTSAEVLLAADWAAIQIDVPRPVRIRVLRRGVISSNVPEFALEDAILPRVVWSHHTQQLAVSSRGDLWLWEPQGRTLERVLTWNTEERQDMGDRAPIWSPDDQWLVSCDRMVDRSLEFPEGTEADWDQMTDEDWEQFALRRQRSAVIDVAVVNVSRRLIWVRMEVGGAVKVLEWVEGGNRLWIRSQFEDTLDQYVNTYLTPVPPAQDQA